MNWFYKNREERSRWLAERFANEIKEANTLIDVGCFNRDIKQYIPEQIAYTGIDIAGQPDFFINLDAIDKLPFEDDSFDVCVCADVLEHLENIHFIFDELCRITSKYIIITLPNAYASIPEFIKGKKYTEALEKRKQFGKFDKFYGLPLEKPEDRHRWFFSEEEAIEFAKYRGAKHNFTLQLAENDYTYKKSFAKRVLKKVNKNFAGQHIIMLLKKER